MTRTARGSLLTVAFTLTCALPLAAGDPPQPRAKARELRVCADPNNLPFSNQREEGFENRLAQLVARDLHARVRYTWLAQRRGFIRRTLRVEQCDVIMGIPTGYELVLSTEPYYTSSYVFVYPKSRHLNLRSLDDPVLRNLKIGVHAFSNDGANTPPAHALAARGITGNLVGYTLWDADSVPNPPGKVIDALTNGAIDVAIVWGPFGGYYARHAATELEVVPVAPAVDASKMVFVYGISMGVKKGNTKLKQELESVLDRRRTEVRKILEEFGVPIVAEPARTTEQQGEPSGSAE